MVGVIVLLEVRDLSGRLVLQERLPPWSQVHAVDLSAQATGLYNCTVRWGASSVSTRIIIAEP